MKLAKYSDLNEIWVVDAQVPEIEPGDILVKTKVCGICGTDLLEWYRKIKKSPFLGHEVTGVIEKAGKNVDAFKEGDRVFIHHHVPCFVCHYCRRGKYTMCSTYHSTHFDPAGMAEFVRVPELNVTHGGVIKLPDNVSFEQGSLLEPVGCCLRGIANTNLHTGDTVLIIGAGFTGLIHAQLARMMGASLVIVSDFFDFKLAKAKEMGADVTINPGKENMKEKLYMVNQARGADIVIVTPASTRAIQEAVEYLDKGGHLYLFGPTSPDDYVSLLPYTFFFSELSLSTSYSATAIETNAACKLIQQKRLQTNGLITHRFNINEVQKAIGIAKKADASLKVIIEF